MNILQRFRSHFSKDRNRYTEWKLVEEDIPGYIIISGKEVIRMVDVYERYDIVNQEYQIKKIYKLPNRFTFR